MRRALLEHCLVRYLLEPIFRLRRLKWLGSAVSIDDVFTRSVLNPLPVNRHSMPSVSLLGGNLRRAFSQRRNVIQGGRSWQSVERRRRILQFTKSRRESSGHTRRLAARRRQRFLLN